MPGAGATIRSITMEQRLLRCIDALAQRLAKRLVRKRTTLPPHLAAGLRGEEEALFRLRKQGYVIVARRWKTPKVLGDVDLIGWEDGTLCFIEVKTRTGRGIVPAEFAVDAEKQKMLRSMASVYRKRFPEPARREIVVRFDVVSVYLPVGDYSEVEVDLFQGAFHR